MYPTSAAYKTAVKTSHKVVSKAEVWSSDRKLIDLDISSGSVSVSVSNNIRRTCTVNLTTTRSSDNLVPDDGFDYLTPFGNQLRLYRGVQFDDGTTEYIPLGVFVITEVSITDTNNGTDIALRGEDKSIIVSRNKWTAPYQMVNGTLEASLTALLTNRYPDIQIDFPTTNITVNQVTLGADSQLDPWQDATNIAELVGYDLYFNVKGVCTMRQFPTLDASAVVATYKEGDLTTVTDLSRNISTKETYNGVIYTLEGSQVPTPIRVEAWDEDTTSPTYRYGVFGSVPTFITSNLLTTQADAIKAATALLNNYIGAQETVDFNSIVDASLDVNDVIYIKATGAKVDRTVIIDGLEIPLEYTGTMGIKTRVVRIVNASESVSVGVA